LWKNTPLHYAAINGKEKCAEMLLKYGARLDISNAEGWKCKELT